MLGGLPRAATPVAGDAPSQGAGPFIGAWDGEKVVCGSLWAAFVVAAIGRRRQMMIVNFDITAQPDCTPTCVTDSFTVRQRA